jgi:lipopolysaccharide export LptBFGC system permease protein LptF
MVIVGACVLASAVLVVAIPPMFQGPSDLLTLLVSIAYPILDMALLSVAVPVFFFFRRGTYWRPMLYVLVGITLQLIGDVVFIITLVGNWNPQDLIFDWSYLMLALGFYKWLKPVITS